MKPNRSAAKAAPRRSTSPAPTSAAEPATAAPADLPSRDALVREAAYALYERRGCVYGHELEDWLAAEAQVDAELAATAAARNAAH
ncbi:MAG: DUF2934 domain-containing protein [Burkholderiales bacterium]|nr:DUF2934 domain-containing protein [Burkholderiales bacterium]MDE2457129.1 DUF2934 domain-containing protein [Burkholderiales bacterium]